MKRSFCLVLIVLLFFSVASAQRGFKRALNTSIYDLPDFDKKVEFYNEENQSIEERMRYGVTVDRMLPHL